MHLNKEIICKKIKEVFGEEYTKHVLLTGHAAMVYHDIKPETSTPAIDIFFTNASAFMDAAKYLSATPVKSAFTKADGDDIPLDFFIVPDAICKDVVIKATFSPMFMFEYTTIGVATEEGFIIDHPLGLFGYFSYLSTEEKSATSIEALQSIAKWFETHPDSMYENIKDQIKQILDAVVPVVSEEI